MGKLVTISREYGSGGRVIAELLSKKLNVPFYDKKIIDLAVEESGFSKEAIEGAELKAKSSLAYSWASASALGELPGASSMSIADQIFLAQFQTVKKIGEKGEGVVVGRCADYVLKDNPDVIKVFIYAPIEKRIERAVKEYGDNAKDAEKIVSSYDKARKNYYDYHTGQKWGVYTNYDICINTANMSYEDCANIIYNFIANRK